MTQTLRHRAENATQDASALSQVALVRAQAAVRMARTQLLAPATAPAVHLVSRIMTQIQPHRVKGVVLGASAISLVSPARAKVSAQSAQGQHQDIEPQV